MVPEVPWRLVFQPRRRERQMKMKTVSRVKAASPEDAERHFARKFEFETDCWDVHFSMESKFDEMVVLDVRSEDLFSSGHVPGALSLPHPRINEERLSGYARDQLFVVYCAGPHCNGADKAALKLARLGRPVKVMVGGVTGWLDEGFDLEIAEEVAQSG